jgi:hypothetical protein
MWMKIIFMYSDMQENAEIGNFFQQLLTKYKIGYSI